MQETKPIPERDLMPLFGGESQKHYFTIPSVLGSVTEVKIVFEVRNASGVLVMRKATTNVGGESGEVGFVEPFADTRQFYITIGIGDTNGFSSSYRYAARVQTADAMIDKVIAWGNWPIVTAATRKAIVSP